MSRNKSRNGRKRSAKRRQYVFNVFVQLLAVALVLVFSATGLWLIFVDGSSVAVTGGCTLLAAVIAAVIYLGRGQQ